MHGPKEGAARHPGHASTLTSVSCPQLRQVANSRPTPRLRMFRARMGSIGNRRPLTPTCRNTAQRCRPSRKTHFYWHLKALFRTFPRKALSLWQLASVPLRLSNRIIGQRFKTNGLSIVRFFAEAIRGSGKRACLDGGRRSWSDNASCRSGVAEALLLVDVDSGRVISERNSTYPWYPASVTKLMTTYVTLKAVRDHRINLDSVLMVSPNAVAQNPFKMGLKVGTEVTVDNALKMLLVHSPNDIAVVLAEGVSGSIEKFAEEMNAAAHHLGMTQTNYVNPNGLPAEEQVTSARDLAILARAMIREFPEYDYYWHIASIRLGKRIFRNTNRLIDAYAGADGMKTGFTCGSGFNLV